MRKKYLLKNNNFFFDMKIIKKGKIECEECGCVFLADENDVNHTVMMDYVICSTCGQYISRDC